MPNKTLISIKNAKHTYYVHKTEQYVLGNAQKGFDFQVNEGEHIAILGANGAGKSTFLRLLRGDAWLKSGEISWLSEENGSEYMEHTPLTAKSMCVLVSNAEQERYLKVNWNITAEELLSTGFSKTSLLYNELTTEQKEKLYSLAEELNISHLLNNYVPTLSHGQLRILLLARAILSSAKIILLDEYTDGLDVYYREQVFSLLEKISHKATFVMTTHRLETLPHWIKKSYYLKDGFFSSTIPNEYTLEGQLQITCDEKLALEERESNNTSALANFPPLIDIKNADVYVDSNKVLHQVNWIWKRDEHWLIHGANGSGKSTFLKLLAGDLYPALGGSITRHLPSQSLNGEIYTMREIKKLIRLVSDKLQATYSYDINCYELILSGIDNTIGIYREFTEKEHDEAMQWMQFTQMENFKNRSIFSLSTGQLRRLLLARAMLGKPEILLLDEPYNGLDVFARKDFNKLLENLIENNVHIVVVSHHEKDSYLCTKSAKIDKDELILIK